LFQLSAATLRRVVVLFGPLLLTASAAIASPSLQPTHAGLVRQSQGAREAGLSYLENDQQVHDFVRRGLLVTLRGNDDYFIHPDVRHAAARPEVKAFVERLAQQYHTACGERLVVTSLVRPRNRQPWNSDPLSVHPTGMAVDLRISVSPSCRRWLESTLLDLEGDGLVEAARERVVPHYHVVVFPSYGEQLERRGIELPAATGTILVSAPGIGPIAIPAFVSTATTSATLPAAMRTVAGGSGSTRTVPAVQRSLPRRTSATAGKATSARRVSATKRSSTRRYKVRRGDNLWTIARQHGITVQAIRRANRIPSRLKPGQVLAIPAR
jgi:LysM repeat protein